MELIFEKDLTFGVFADICKFITSDPHNLQIPSDVHYFKGSDIADGIPHGHFIMAELPEGIAKLKNEARVFEWLPADKKEKYGRAGYMAIVLHVKGKPGNRKLILQEKGQMDVNLGDRWAQVLDFEKDTNIILLMPIYSGQENRKVWKTRYQFKEPLYTKDGDLYLGYYEQREITHMDD